MARLDPDNRSRPFLPVDMTQLARSVAEDLSPIAEQKHIHLWAVSETPTVVVANEDALRLLMTNLCDNALRYTPEGGEIRIETLVRDTRLPFVSAITVPASRKPSAKESLNVSTERKERKQFRHRPGARNRAPRRRAARRQAVYFRGYRRKGRLL